MVVHIVIMGCGRVGSTLAHILEDRGNTVAVIDRDPEAFRRLKSSFKGDKITGIGFDRAVLTQAGIERADAFVAVSSGDNSNIISARVARETFSVERVVARIYDPRRAEVYERLGIPTVATVRWTADQMLRKIVPEGGEPLWRDPTGKIVLVELTFSPAWIGEQVKALEASTMTRIAFIDRLGQAFVPEPGTVLQEGDVLHVVARESELDRIAGALATRGGER
jgi:trk system potassium uptake protein